MKRFLLLILFGFVFSGMVSTTLMAASSGAGAVEYHHGQLSVAFKDIPIRTALEQVSSQAGIQFLLDPAINTNLSIKFTDLPLKVALKRLLRSQSHALVHSAAKDGSYHISQVKVFKKGTLSASRFEQIGQDVSKSGQPVAAFGVSGNGVGSGQESVVGDHEVAIDQSSGSQQSRINVQGVRGPAQVMEAMAKNQADIAMLHRKAEGETRALQFEMARAQAALASGQGDGRELMQKINTLEQQKARNMQNTLAMLKKAEEERVVIQNEYVNLKTPAQQQIEARAMQAKQYALNANRVPAAELARRTQLANQATAEARIKANALNNAARAKQNNKP